MGRYKEFNLDQSLDDIAFTHGAALPDGGGDEEPVLADDDDNWFQNMLLNAPSPRPHDYSDALAGDRAGDSVEGEDVERLVSDLSASFGVAGDFLGEERLDEDELSMPLAHPSSSDASEPVARLQAASAA